MKKSSIYFSIYSFILVFVLAFFAVSCSSSEKKQENTAVSDFSTQVTPPQKEALNQWVLQYFKVKNALVATNVEKAKESATEFTTLINATKTDDFQGESLSFLTAHQQTLLTHLAEITNTSDVEVQRTALSGVTQSVYEITKAFKPNAQKVYYQFCPMAFDDKGGYWLNEEEKVYNPYFGDKMLHCGKVQETL